MKETEILRKGLYAAKGLPRVNGPAGRDKVPAMLTRGEAVLTPGAARAIGRGNIAKLNAKHAPKGATLRSAAKTARTGVLHAESGFSEDMGKLYQGGKNLFNTAADKVKSWMPGSGAGAATPGAAPAPGATMPRTEAIYSDGSSSTVRPNMEGKYPAIKDPVLNAGQNTGNALNNMGKATGQFLKNAGARAFAPAADTTMQLMDHGSFYTDDNVSFGDKLKQGARDLGGTAVRGVGAALGGTFGAGVGSVVPVGGTLAGGVAGGAAGYYGADKLQDKLFGDDGEALKAWKANGGKAPAAAMSTSIPAPAAHGADKSMSPEASDRRMLDAAIGKTRSFAEPQARALEGEVLPKEAETSALPRYATDVFHEQLGIQQDPRLDPSTFMSGAQQAGGEAAPNVRLPSVQNQNQTLGGGAVRAGGFNAPAPNGNKMGGFNQFPTAGTFGAPGLFADTQNKMAQTIANANSGPHTFGGAMAGIGAAKIALAQDAMAKSGIMQMGKARLAALPSMIQRDMDMRKSNGEAWDKAITTKFGKVDEKSGTVHETEKSRDARNQLNNIASTLGVQTGQMSPEIREHVLHMIDKNQNANDVGAIIASVKAMFGDRMMTTENPLRNQTIKQDGMFVKDASTGWRVGGNGSLIRGNADDMHFQNKAAETMEAAKAKNKLMRANEADDTPETLKAGAHRR